MNEEEKKVVERIEDTFYSDLGKGINKFQKITLYEDSIRDVRIILNLIEKMKNCINILDDELKERNKTINEKEIIIEKLQKENEELKKNYINIQNNTNTTFHKVVPPPEPQLPTKTLCESFSKKMRNK